MPQPDALVLCGGQSARLGGIDKPLSALAGKPLIAHVLASLAAQTDRIVLSANRNRKTYAALGHPVVDDGSRHDCGPLAGIAAGLAHATSEFVLCVPGDAPLLPPDLVERLDTAKRDATADIAHVHDGDGPQPLCALVRRSLLADLERYLDDEGGKAPQVWFRRHRAVAANFADWPRWAWSLNTAEEWQQAEQALAALTLKP